MKHKNILLAFLIISSLYAMFVIIQAKKTDIIQDQVDELFLKNISDAELGFALDYSKMDESTRLENYIETAGSLKTARQLVFYTSFNEGNKYLSTCLNHLYLCMTEDSSRKLVLKEKDKIFRYLVDIAQNPTDVDKAKELSELSGNIYFEKK